MERDSLATPNSNVDTSEITEDTTFSTLAKGSKRRRSNEASPTRKKVGAGNSVYRLSSRSWAQLTSGVADNGWSSR